MNTFTHRAVALIRSTRRALGTSCLALALLARGALAAPDDLQSAAAKDFDKGVKAELATLKSAIKAAEKEAVQELADFEQNLKNGVLLATSTVATNLANRIEDY